MGRKSNRKWIKRVNLINKTKDDAMQLRLIKLYSGHPKFEREMNKNYD